MKKAKRSKQNEENKIFATTVLYLLSVGWERQASPYIVITIP
jgi:hypothetical protein